MLEMDIVGIIKSNKIDMQLAIECSNSYSNSTGLGCNVISMNGEVLHETGYACSCCTLCSSAGIGGSGGAHCVAANAYGIEEAQRFGGKYVYFCPMGLNCFASPIIGQMGIIAKVTAGPFLMTDLDDYIEYDLKHRYKIDETVIGSIMPVLQRIPRIHPNKANSLSTLLFMAVGFLNNVAAANQIIDNQNSEFIQRQVSDFIRESKSEEKQQAYPFETEQALMASISEVNKPKAQRLLNELMGHILFHSGGDLTKIRTRIYELLVMLSRATVHAGASPEYAFHLTHEFFVKSQSIQSIENMCFALTKVMNQFIECIFPFSDINNVNVIQKSVRYINRNYAKKVSVGSVAQVVNLTPSYFSKIFKKEMGCNFNTYLNVIRIEKSMKLLLYGDFKMKLANIATTVGFDDQSYFTKVFKRMTGMSPHIFRETGGRMQMEKINPHLRRLRLMEHAAYHGFAPPASP